MYRALADPVGALQAWTNRPADFKPEAGNSLAHTYAWIAALSDLGQIDRTVSADTPWAAVFLKDGRRTHVAWNLAAVPREVVFSDGVRLVCPARGQVMQ
jgi:hypothetical protein